MQQITKKTLARSALVGLFLTIEGMGLQVAKSRLLLHSAPPSPGHLLGVTACYLVAGFTFALGFFLFSKQLPGRTWIGKGLRYSAVILVAVWVSGFIGFGAIDFTGGWNLLSSAKREAFFMALCDCFNFLVGGLLLGLIARRDEPAAPVVGPFTANLAVRIATGALLLPVLCAGIFFFTTLALPSGFDLSGEKASMFYVFLFAPLAISGAGTALFHDALRSAPGSSIVAESFKVCLILFSMYWVANATFVLFFGFTWQVFVDFLVAMAVSLYLTVVTLEMTARARPLVVTRQA